MVRHYDTWLYAVTGVIWLVLFFSVKLHRKKNDEYKSSSLDGIGMGIAQINTQALQGIIRQVIEGYERGKYAASTLDLPQENMETEFLQHTTNTILTDLQQGIHRQIVHLEIGDIRIRERKDGQMFAVMELTAEASVSIQYSYFHAGTLANGTESGKKRYRFRSELEGWKLYGVDTITE